MIHFIHTLLSKLFLKMGSQKGMHLYTFKAFRCEKLSPTCCKVPLPRSGHRVVCDSKNLYSFGGYNPDNDDNARGDDTIAVASFPLFQELWKFNYVTKKWKLYKGQNSLPQELASNAVIREGNYLMVFGGTGSPFGNQCSNQLYVCKLSDEKGSMFEIKTTGEHPTPQYGQALVYHNNYLYTIGGTTGYAYTCDIHRLNMRKKVWESVYVRQGFSDTEPEGRYRHEVSFDGKNIYILGGGTSEEAFDFFFVPVFEIETRKWMKVRTKSDPKMFTKPGIPPSRRCHGAVQVEIENDIHVFISGGYDGDLVFDDLWRLELSTMQWTCIEQCAFPKPVYFHSASVSPEGKMHVFGGIYAGEDMQRSNDIYSVWLGIPRLSEMCWEALLHYNPLITTYSKEKLINMGLPMRFIQRLE